MVSKTGGELRGEFNELNLFRFSTIRRIDADDNNFKQLNQNKINS